MSPGRLVPAGLGLAVVLAGCAAVGNDYQRPSLDLPPAYRGPSGDGASLGAADWRSVFGDPRLQALIATALAQNMDLQLAEARIREGQAGVVIARSGALPGLALGLATTPTARTPGESFTSTFTGAGLLNWEIDLWGRIARNTEAARGDLGALQAARDGARVSLIAQVASLYYQLAAARETQAITRSSIELQAESLRVLSRRQTAGLVSMAEVRQSEAQLTATTALLPDLVRQVAALENALSVLISQPPGRIESSGTDAPLPVSLPAGLPSELVERRPDLLAAEQQLIAANARVGAAKAAMLPSLSITGTFGRISTELHRLLGNGAASVSSIGPNLSQKLYAGGALDAAHAAAVSRLDQALIAYRHAGLVALQDVSDALIAYEQAGTRLDSQGLRTVSQREALRLVNKRFDAGVVSFLEVLDAQRQLLAAETDLVNSRLSRQLALVQFYRALGGGWSAPVAATG
jgi:multidrug efflux system outer membrane protein